MPLCAGCQHEIPADCRFCPACGATLTDASLRATGPFRGTPNHDTDPPGHLAPGALLAGRYRIVACLGKGGMGEVYRADDLTLGQSVALKFLPANFADNPDRLARFRQEVKIARQVSHPNVCRVYDIGEWKPSETAPAIPFLTMEYIDGQDLAHLLRQVGRLPEDKGIDLARQLCLGLAAAHDKGVLHRDLKPQNVMIDGRGQARLTDFGLASFANQITETEITDGTPAYMAPEQLAGKEVTVKSDLFSLGLILYEIFTGKRAFPANTRQELLKRYEDSTPSKPSSHVTGLDPVVERQILRCLEKDPAKRPKSALAVLAGLPGGDPLAAALAAGETPSPEMVADASIEGILPLPLAGLLITLVVLGLVFAAFAANKVRLYRRVPFDMPPQELAFKARGVIEQLGFTEPAVGKNGRFVIDISIVNYLKQLQGEQHPMDRLITGQPAAVFFCYRQSPQYMEGRFGRVMPWDPPLTLPGMILVNLDLKGRLIEFRYVPGQAAPEAHTTSAAPWPALFAAAGLPMQEFREVAPAWVPPVYADQHVAWEGVFPDQPEIPLRIEAASLAGKPVSFRLIGPWLQPMGTAPLSRNIVATLADAFNFGQRLIPFFGGLLLAWWQWRQGRANLRSASYLALFVFAMRMLQWLTGADHVPAANSERNMLVGALGLATDDALLLWVAYLAIEPYVRRRWPWRIASWERVMEGRFRDPLVGREVLLGCLFGLAMHLLLTADALVARWLGWSSGNPLYVFIVNLNEFWAGLFGWSVSSVFYGLTWYLILFMLYLLFRREGIAAAIVWALATVYHMYLGASVDAPLLRGIFGGAAVAMMIYAGLRFGILPLVVGLFINWVVQNSLIAPDLSTWYARDTIIALGVPLALAVYGFIVSLGDRPLLAKGLLEEA